jgi:hypothetical protein
MNELFPASCSARRACRRDSDRIGSHADQAASRPACVSTRPRISLSPTLGPCSPFPLSTICGPALLGCCSA